jgi:hypothetical protein
MMRQQWRSLELVRLCQYLRRLVQGLRILCNDGSSNYIQLLVRQVFVQRQTTAWRLGEICINFRYDGDN